MRFRRHLLSIVTLVAAYAGSASAQVLPLLDYGPQISLSGGVALVPEPLTVADLLAIGAPRQQGRYIIPVPRQEYHRPCGTMATDICKVPVTIPPGDTADQVLQMAQQALASGRKPEALSYLEKAAEMGSLKAQWSVGVDYLNGNGEMHDDQQAIHWLSLAADSGYAPAEYKLGAIYEQGIQNSVARDPVRAVQLYKAAADQRNGDAELALGLDYELGSGVAHDRPLAIAYLRRAATHGQANATAIANFLGRTREPHFDNIDQIFIAMAPPAPKVRPSACPNFSVWGTGTRQMAIIYTFCNCHPGCTYNNGNSRCFNAGATPYCSY